MKVTSAAEGKRLGIYLLIPGLALLMTAGYIAFRELRFRTVAVPAIGKYTDEGGSPVGGGRTIFTYYITYKSQGGGSYQFIESGVTEQLPEGKPLDILYDPSDPKEARLSTRDGWYLPRNLGPAGFLFTMLGFVLIRRRSVHSSTNSPETTAVK
ncbi:MAG: DUF3592 domain-containing protein [bacterium]|jgi:hypothetical protein